MTVPGLNLLSIALRVQGNQPVRYERFAGRVADAAGRLVDSYFPPVAVMQCSLQPVPRTRYEVLGLPMTQDHYTWFVPRKVVGLERDSAGDVIEWQGKRMKLGMTTDWHGADGWMAIICVVLKGKNA